MRRSAAFIAPIIALSLVLPAYGGNAPSCAANILLPTGGFTASANQILTPSGTPFVARGIDVWDWEVSYINTILAQFPNVTMIRLASCSGQTNHTCYNSTPDTVASLTPFINSMTALGIVVEIEDHSAYVDPNIISGTALTNELAWYRSFAVAFANNPYVWFGTMNEPLDSANPVAIANQEQSIYNTIRGAGNNTIVMLELSGGTGASFAQSHSSIFNAMSNVVWDFHSYGGDSNYSTNQTTVTNTFNTDVAAAQTVTSTGGTIPIIVGEYGPATGNSYDANYNQVIYTVQQAESQYGSLAWTLWDYGPNIMETSEGGSLNSWGSEVSTFLRNGSTSSF